MEKLLRFEPNLEEIIDRALKEDIGTGDLTTEFLVDGKKKARGIIIAEEKAVVCGLYIVKRIFEKLDQSAEFRSRIEDGKEVEQSKIVAEIEALAKSLLTGERVALNFLQKLSGVATMTRKFVKAVEGTGVAIAGTRKTSPLLRGLQKYAIEVGGGMTHRLRLDDGILIKDNHLAVVGEVKQAVKKAKAKAPSGMKVEVEVKGLGELKEALEAKADIILLDNMNLKQLKEAVKMNGGRAILEASGGVGLENVRKIAETGVNYISVGALTHSTKAVHFTMNIIPIDE